MYTQRCLSQYNRKILETNPLHDNRGIGKKIIALLSQKMIKSFKIY